MFISFIVPVYNVENYLRECINGLLALALTDYEIILVIGKSGDSSDEICMEYAQKNEYVQVINQDGRGLSDARNCGLKVANGDYIAFVDSDDYLIPNRMNALLQYIRQMSDVELFVSDFVRVFETGKLVESTQIEPTTLPIVDANYLKRFLSQPGCFWNVWRYVYKKSFLIDNQLWFRQEVFSEDIDYTIRTLLLQPKIAFYHNPYYYYRVRRPASLMNTNTIKRLRDTIMIISDCALWAASSSHPCRCQIIEHMVFEWIVNLANIFELPKQERPQAVALFKEHREIVKLSSKLEHRLFACFLDGFGVLLMANCMQVVKRIRRIIKKYM
ncbi:MAG: glycosyltransferase [Hydrogenoanaerobacterium sp.]